MRPNAKHLLVVFFLLTAIITKAQEKPFVNAYKTTETIVLDGIADEVIWQRAQPAKDFYQYFPSLFQYNNQVDNFSTNIRFQWRYKPVSD
jgi:hypothetical protein